MSRREVWAVVGASRGLGSEFVAQLEAAGHEVIALNRADGYDVRDESAFDLDQPLDAVILNAGIQNRAGALADPASPRAAGASDAMTGVLERTAAFCARWRSRWSSTTTATIAST